MERGTRKPGRWVGIATGLLVWLVIPFSVSAALDPTDPHKFFTNVASRLLKSELNLELTRIQVWPTNQYTPAVHRLLQISANLLDATTNRFNTNYPFFPSVFRPVFQRDGDAVYINGYVEVNDSSVLTNTMRALVSTTVAESVQPNDLIFGFPLIIGAKKGFPNFNEFAMQSVFQISRKLQITRPSFASLPILWRTNMAYVVGLSNVIGVEAWNSYRSNYTRAVDIHVTNFMSMHLTNDFGADLTTHSVHGRTLSIPNPTKSTWNEFNPSFYQPSFIIPLKTNLVFLPDSVFLPNPPRFEEIDWNTAWDESQTFPIPDWKFYITNRLQFVMVDRETDRIIDFVMLDGLNAVRDLSEEIRDPDDATGFNGLWSTNRINGSVPLGIYNQIDISLGHSGGLTTDWTAYGSGQPTAAIRDFEIDLFRVLHGLTPFKYPGLVNTSLVFQVPFTPTKRISQYLVWQANDPLIHYRAETLKFFLPSGEIQKESLKTPVQPIQNIGHVNDAYRPWGGNPFNLGGDLYAFHLAVKDPLIRESEAWSLPDSAPLNLDTLSRIHRGTPWQTVYLKSAGVDLDAWMRLNGTIQQDDARLTMPTNDWRIASLFAMWLNTNQPGELLSINERDENFWTDALDEMLVLTNSSSDGELNQFIPIVNFDNVLMESESSQAATIAGSISQVRLNQIHGYFQNVGDLLSIPTLSAESPWLNRSSTAQLQKGISDEAYEKIPVQLLARVRSDSVGTLSLTNGSGSLRFAGFDGFSYSVETSSNLFDWTPIATNSPVNGTFELTIPLTPGVTPQFFRSALLP